MAWAFSESWEPYAATADTVAGYWDSGTTTQFTLTAGRFSGSRAISMGTGSGGLPTALAKSSGTNDAVHHISLAILQGAALTGTTLGFAITFIDGATNQCSLVFRSDGALLLASGLPNGTVLATYTGAISAQSTWTQFEIEVVINNTSGSIAVRKNGSASNDFFLGSLNTRPGTNAYANKIAIGQFGSVNPQQVDDLIWRSDASSVPWIGDVRIVARAPASDVAVQFSRSASSVTQTYPTATTTSSFTTNTTARYTQITPTYSGVLASVSISWSQATGNLKCAVFADNGSGGPGAILQNAGSAALTGGTVSFAVSVAVTKGVPIWFGFISDVAASISVTINSVSSALTQTQTGTSYAAFPQASPVTTSPSQAYQTQITYATNVNWPFVAEPQQDAATSYVYSSNPGDADFYGLAALSVTPQQVFGVTTRCFAQKSDAGARSGAVQLRSGGTTVQSTSTALSSSWGWLWRTDVTDPNTGSAWTPTGVNNAQIGPTVVS